MDVRDIDALWAWILGPLFEIVYSDKTPGAKEGALLGYDYILNGLRVRQVRIKPEMCPTDLPEWALKAYDLAEAFGPRCYNSLRGAVSTILLGSNEDRENYGGLRQDGTPVFTWSDASPWSPWYFSEVASYPPSGFNMDLPAFNATKAQDVIDLYRKNRFFDVQTRGVFIDVTLYNPNMNELLIVRLVAEQSQFGGIVPSYTFLPIRLYMYNGFWGQIQLIFEIMYFILLLKYTLEEIGWLLTLRLKFIYRFQGMYVSLVLGLSLSLVVIRIGSSQTFSKQKFIGDATVSSASLAVHTMFQPTDNLQAYVYLEDNIIAVLSVIVYCRFFLHLADSMVLRHIYRMLRSALFEIIPFCVLFMIIFLGFSLGFFVVFGTQVSAYRTYSRSLVTNFKMISGESSVYEEIYAINWLMAPLLYYSLFAIQFVVVFNVFFAVIIHTYAVYKNELELDPEDCMKDIIYQAAAWLLSFFGIQLDNRKVAPEAKPTVVERVASGDDRTPKDLDGRRPNSSPTFPLSFPPPPAIPPASASNPVRPHQPFISTAFVDASASSPPSLRRTNPVTPRLRPPDDDRDHKTSEAAVAAEEMIAMMDDALVGMHNPPNMAFHGGGTAQVGVSPELESQLKDLIKRSNAVDSLRTELLSVSDRINALTEYILAEPTSKIQKQVQLVNRKLDLLAEAL